MKGMTTTMAVTDNVLIGERIKKQRLLNGYSRETLAEMAGITPRFCYDLELGLKSMSLATRAAVLFSQCLRRLSSLWDPGKRGQILSRHPPSDHLPSFKTGTSGADHLPLHPGRKAG